VAQFAWLQNSRPVRLDGRELVSTRRLRLVTLDKHIPQEVLQKKGLKRAARRELVEGVQEGCQPSERRAGGLMGNHTLKRPLYEPQGFANGAAPSLARTGRQLR
jgi:hypothetical protein